MSQLAAGMPIVEVHYIGQVHISKDSLGLEPLAIMLTSLPEPAATTAGLNPVS